MTTKSLGSKVGIIALLGALPVGCADDITNPFTATDGNTGSGSSGNTGGPDDGADDGAETGPATGTTGGTGTDSGGTMALDDTAGGTMVVDGTAADSGTTAADSGTTAADSGTTAGSGDTMASESGDSSTTSEVSNHVPCPGDAIPTDKGLPVTVSANSSQQDSDFGGSCGGGGAPEYTWTFTAPMDGDYIFDTFQSTFDTVLYVLDGECAGEEIACDDDGLAASNQSLTSVSLLADQTVTVVVDAFGLTGGNITLTAREGSVTCPVSELDAVPVSVTGQTVVATNEFAGSCGAGEAPDTGYLFTAPADGTYTFEITNNDFDTVLYLLDGNCSGDEVACNDNLAGGTGGASGLTHPMAMGEQVTVVVDGFFEDFGNFDLNIGVLEGDCPDSDLGMMEAPFTVSGSTMGEDNASAGSCGGLSAPDFAYTWTAPVSAGYRFSTENSDFDTVLYLQEGNDCLGAEIACSNDTALGTEGSTTATVEAGDTVTIIVDGNGEEGAYDLVVDVDCPGMDLGNVVPQTITDNNLVSSDIFAPSCGTGGAPDEGYVFTAPSDGTYVFETTNNDFDTVLFVLDAVCGGNELACNNDLPGAAGGASGLTLALTQDQVVTIGVEGFFSATGNYDLTISQLMGDCPDEDLGDTGVPFTVSGDTTAEDNGVAGSCGGLTSNDYSYTWIAPSDGTFLFSTAGSAFDTVLYVSDGSCVGAELGCNDDADGTPQSTTFLPLTMGQEVVITVDGSGAAGMYDLSIEEASDCCFPHDYAGCDDQDVEDCVCALDAFCCNNQWDGLCTSSASDDCMAEC